jgi:hypothetical protein
MDLQALIAAAKPGPMPASVPLPPGVDAKPLLVFMDMPVYAVLISAHSSLSTHWAKTTQQALEAAATVPLCGVVALSPQDAKGSAGRVIQAVRARNPGALTVYHGWDYRPEVSGRAALACGADLLVVGGLEANELLGLIFTGLKLKGRGELPAKPSLENYEGVLEQLCPKSPFRQMADTFRSRNAPAMEDA